MGTVIYSTVMRAFLATWFLFVHSFAEVCQKTDQCTCMKSNGKYISLWDIDGGSKGPAFKDIATVYPDGTNFFFDWNPCTKFTEGDGCKDMLMCQKSSGSTETHPCADTVTDFKVESDGSTTIMYKEYTDSVGYKRTVTINLKCDENKSPGEITGVREDYKPSDSKYSTTLTSKCACDDGCSRPEDAGARGSTGLSTGSILLIVFFVLIIVYVIGGILINKYKLGVESMPEMCPNYTFWIGIPSLIKDGFVFTFNGIKSACSSACQKCNKESYANI